MAEVGLFSILVVLVDIIIVSYRKIGGNDGIYVEVEGKDIVGSFLINFRMFGRNVKGLARVVWCILRK